MKEGKKITMTKVYVTFFVMVAFASIVAFQIVNLQLFKKDAVINEVKTTSAGYRPVEADRGDIYASDGSLLATSLHYYLVGLDLNSKALTDENFNAHVSALSDSLAALVGEYSAGEYRRLLIGARKAKTRWFKISNGLTYPEFKRLRSFPLIELGKYKSGLVYKKYVKREKPFKVLAARTIGNRAPFGMEGAYQHYLQGTSGEQYQRRIPGGVWVPVNDRNSVDPINGLDVYSTIDIGIQEIVHNALKDQLLYHQADHGCVVVMESQTGKVRAIANLKLDSNQRVYEHFNYAVGAAVEPGSTFKLASIMALLEDGKVQLDDKVDVGRGVMEFYGQKMEDSHPYEKARVMSVREIFQESSNVGVAKMITKYYGDNPQRFIDRLYGFKLQDKLGVDIHGDVSPKIKDPSDKSNWSGLTLPWSSIGYELELTPVQILAFYNAVANGGNFLRPSFVEKVCDNDRVVEEFKPAVIKKAICSKETLMGVRSLLEGVVNEGTASAGFKGTPYTVAGKTGTTQLNYWKRKSRGERTQYRASFVGYFPADNPTYTCIVVITNPKQNGSYGSQCAVPVFRKISDRLYSTAPSLRRVLAKEKFNYELSLKGGEAKDLEEIAKVLAIPVLGEVSSYRWATAHLEDRLMKLEEKEVEEKGVPNVLSMNLKDALHLLENSGYRVEVKGKGKVVKQSVPPGAQAKKGQTIEIILS